MFISQIRDTKRAVYNEASKSRYRQTDKAKQNSESFTNC